jgi:conjugative relaxase-like TrwC/TraI family protein
VAMSISSGHSAQYLTGQVAQGRESYYLDATTAGEPPGRWSGKGAEAFGLVGEVDHEVMHALYGEFADPRDPKFHDPATRAQAARLGSAPGRYKSAEEILADKIAAESDGGLVELLPERIEQLRLEAERQERQPVAFLDATFSPPKSVTVAHTAFSRMELDAEKAGHLSAAAQWRHRRLVVEEAVWAGNQAMLENLSARAGYSRTGRHGAGAGRWVDAHDWTVASFFQSTSRDLDPQLHIHNAILNRVVCDDGKVRTLDSKAVYAMKQGAGTIGDRTMEAYLSARLGVQWVMRADGHGREIEGVDQQAMDLFSERSAKISRKLSGLLEEFREHFDREPTALELDRLRRQSSMATRRAKTHSGENKEQMLDRWDEELRGEVAGGLARVARTLSTGQGAVPATAGQADSSTDRPTAEAGQSGVATDGQSVAASSDLSGGQVDRSALREVGQSGSATAGQAENAQVDGVVSGDSGATLTATPGTVEGVELGTAAADDLDDEGELDLAQLGAIAAESAAAAAAQPVDRPATGRPVALAEIEEHLARTGPRQTWSPIGVIAEAVAQCQLKRAAFSRSELVRQILLALPDNLQTVRLSDIAETLADQALADPEAVVRVTGAQPTQTVPKELQLASGGSAYAAPGGLRYATRGHVVAEQALRRAGVERGRAAANLSQVDRWLKTSTAGGSLGPDQAAAVRGLMTSGAALSVLVGPAGTGKSHTVGALSEGWARLTGGRVYGLATSQIATEVLAQDGVTARNISQWLAAQARLERNGQARPADRQLKLTAADVVVVDEASMVDTVALEQIRAHVDQAGARLILTGDPRQLAAVGAGGAMEMLADGVADTHTLAEVRRFNQEWERAASLRLRDGDQDVIHEYDRRGRIFDSSTRENAGTTAARAYLGDTLAGYASLVIVPSNAEAASISAHIREQLVDMGRVGQRSLILGMDGNECGVGDLVQARHNDWSLGIINRRRYVVQEIHEDGGLLVRVEGSTDTRALSAQYVEQHLTLGYASTAHSAQGVTVDTSHAVVTPGLGNEGLYVALTRGRQANTAYVVTRSEVADEPTGQTHEREPQSATAVIADMLERETELEKAALVQRAEDLRRAGSMHTIHAQYEEAMRFVNRIRTDGWLDTLAAEGELTEDERLALASDQATDQLSRQLRVIELAGQAPAAVLREAIAEQRLDNAKSIAQVIQYRIDQRHGHHLRPTAEQLGDVPPVDIPEHWQQHLTELGEAAANRRRQLGSDAAIDPPDWAIEALGAVPSDPVARAEWEHRASLVAAYREASPSDEVGGILGPAPGTSTPEKRAAWYSAWTALGRPEASEEESALSEGALRVRVKAWIREQRWAPPSVNAEMRATGQNAARYEQEAAILRAQASAATDETERQRLVDEADGRASLAATMREVEADLAEIADQRAAWIVETAATRDAADRARVELATRGRDIGGEDDRITTEEWLAAHDEAIRAEDEHREIRHDYEILTDTHAAMREQAARQDQLDREAALRGREGARVDAVADDAEVVAADAEDQTAAAAVEVVDVGIVDDAEEASVEVAKDDVEAVDDVDQVDALDSELVDADAEEAPVEVAKDDVEAVDDVDQVDALDSKTEDDSTVAIEDAGLEDESAPAATDSTPEQEDAEDQELPKGVPSPAETAASVESARRAASELANRRSQEEALRQAERDQRAEAAEQSSRDQAWRELQQAEREAAEAANDDDTMSRW